MYAEATQKENGERAGQGKRRRGLKAAESRTGFLLLLPALIAFCAIILYPLARAISFAFYKYTLFTPKPVFDGLANFRQLFESPELLASWGCTIFFVGATTSLTFLFGLSWALIMHQPFRGRNFNWPLSLLPWIFPSVVTAFLWAWIFNGQYGVLNAVLMQLGVLKTPVV